MKNYLELKNQRNEINKQIPDALLEELKCRARNLFAKYPDLYKIRWYQDRPVWNDGDPCYFSIDDIDFLNNENEDYDNEEIYRECFLKDIDETDLEELFGNGRITINSSGELTCGK